MDRSGRKGTHRLVDLLFKFAVTLLLDEFHFTWFESSRKDTDNYLSENGFRERGSVKLFLSKTTLNGVW